MIFQIDTLKKMNLWDFSATEGGRAPMKKTEYINALSSSTYMHMKSLYHLGNGNSWFALNFILVGLKLHGSP